MLANTAPDRLAAVGTLRGAQDLWTTLRCVLAHTHHPSAVQASPPAVRQVKSRQISAEHELIQELERKVESWRRKVRPPPGGLSDQRSLATAPSHHQRAHHHRARPVTTARAAQVELLKSKEAALEKNVEQLYSAAKRRVARQEEELQALRTH